MHMDNRVGIDCGSGGGWDRGEQCGKSGTTVIELKNNKNKNKCYLILMYIGIFNLSFCYWFLV